MAGGRPNVGGREAKPGELKPVYYWDISVRRHTKEDVEKGLIDALKKAELKRGSLRRSRFRSDGIEVHLKAEEGARTRIRVDFYAADNAEKLEETRKAIQYEIDNQKLILRTDYGYYDKESKPVSYTASLGDEAS